MRNLIQSNEVGDTQSEL